MLIARKLYIGKTFICLFVSAVSIAFTIIIIKPWDKACTMRVRQLIDEHILLSRVSNIPLGHSQSLTT